MKKIIPLVVLLIAAIGVFVYSVNYRNNRQAQQNINSESTTENIDTDNTITEADIIAENTEAGCRLYYKNNIVTLVYSGATLDFNNCAKAVESETPELYYNDFDNDGDKELIIKFVDDLSDITGKEEKSYILYLITPEEKDGETVLSYTAASKNTWKNVFDNLVKFEITQLTDCKKYLQFAMNDSSKDIKYDEKTGITDNKHVSYARADCSDKKKFYTVSNYRRGLGIYDIQDDGSITLDVQVIINYEEAVGNYHIGNIHCNMMIEKGEFMVKPKTISFSVLDSYKINDPRDRAEDSWSYTVNNTDTVSAGNALIKNINADFSVSPRGNAENRNFSRADDDMKYIESVEINESGVVLKAKSGAHFDAEQTDNGRFEIINGNEDISYTAEIREDELVIRFDKTYEKDALSNIKIGYGE